MGKLIEVGGRQCCTAALTGALLVALSKKSYHV
jgi:hypothetical protein